MIRKFITLMTALLGAVILGYGQQLPELPQ